ncbi:hypothetical protein MetexDRAFT_1095 [Methylorubrum extorquens DSM 13060]|jgi:hypothetical protein|uniref:Uncharacterized protein n=2 Tax=Methylorubrum extorquens TaxID=408 RepID=C5AUI2_METEA|nr:Hypothetical protein MexAM1_META1p2839 [Methylorubrum extorquens AM1]EHP93977.1 hypothetical protein MetexDRAFT_1095 [Methylorubrum extorquens DSM 13060]BDL40008.1 hypothetical protein MSPGM_25980 [Methylorubrum sp. GM97]
MPALFVWSWSKLVAVREGAASADQQQIQHDRGDAARHGQAEDDDAAELIDGIHVLTDAVLELIR